MNIYEKDTPSVKLTTPEHLRVDRAEFDRRIAERLAAGATKEFVRPAPLSGRAKQQAMERLAALASDSAQESAGLPDASFQELLDSIPDLPSQPGNRGCARKISPSERKDRTKTLNWIDSMIPPWCRGLFNGVGVISAANRILTEIKKTGACKLFYGTIASACGVCKKTVQRAVALLKLAGFNVTPGRYDPLAGRSSQTVITVANNKLREWISRHFRGGGQQSPSSSIIERFFLRPAPPNAAAGREAPS